MEHTLFELEFVRLDFGVVEEVIDDGEQMIPTLLDYLS